MSTTIDQKVVEMRFDNKNFESNVSTTMSTLEKLKHALKLDGVTKGLENIGAAAKKVDISGVGSAVESTQNKFGALEVMAVTALANITNSAVNAGKRIVSALTIDPVKSGFQEYETQINAVQTILANTSHKGTTIDQVNNALDELNYYADKTIYNFTEMTRNIGTFTAAGVELDTSVAAIKGIANLAAMSGSTSAQASTAMYQLSQAIAAGRINLMDWNSVVNAGMGGEIFQNALRDTAEAMGIAVDRSITFRESLSSKGDPWLTSDVLLKTLEQFTGDMTEAEIVAQGFTKEQAKAILEMGKTATDAATKVKTFTQLIDTTKEAIQSGWSMSWKLIIGNFEEAKEIFSSAANFIGEVVERSSDARNALIKATLSSPWEKLTEKVEGAGIATEDFKESLMETAKAHGVNVKDMINDQTSFEDTLQNGWLTKDIIIETLKKYSSGMGESAKATEDMTAKLAYFQEVVDKVWHGDYYNGVERVDALTKAGYNYAEVQDLVNKTVDGHRLTLADLNETQLEAVGYTEEEIKAIKELAAEAEEAGTSLNKLLDDMQKPSGKTLLLESLASIGRSLVAVFYAVGDAFEKIFPSEERAQFLYDILYGFAKFTKAVEVTDDRAKNLQRTFEGLFAVLDIVATITGGALRFAFTVIGEILNIFSLDIFDVTASLGDMVVALRDWIDQHNIFKSTAKGVAKAIAAVIRWFGKATKAIGEWIGKFKEIPEVKTTIDKFEKGVGRVVGGIKNHLSSTKDRVNEFIGRVKAMDKLTLADVGNAFKDFWKNVVGYFFNFGGWMDKLKDKLVAFKDKVVYAFQNFDLNDWIDAAKTGIGKFTAFAKDKLVAFKDGVVNVFKRLRKGSSDAVDGLKDDIGGFFGKLGGVFEKFKNAVKVVVDFLKEKFSDVTIGKLISIGLIASILVLAKKISDIVDFLHNPLEMFEDMVSSFSRVANAIAFKAFAEGIKSLAVSIAILAGSIAILTLCDQDKVIAMAGVLGALIVVLSAAGVVIGKFKVGPQFATYMLGLTAGVLILAVALREITKICSEVDTPGQLVASIVTLGAIMLAMVGVSRLLGKVNGKVIKDALGTVALLVAFAASIMMVVEALKDITSLDVTVGDVVVLGGIIGGLIGVLAILNGSSLSFGGSFSIMAIPIAIRLILGVLKEIGKTDFATVLSALPSLIVILLTLKAVFKAASSAGGQATKAGSSILAMAVAIGLLVPVIKALGSMDAGTLTRGVIAVGILELLFGALIAVSRIAGEHASKAGSMLIKMSLALLVLTGAIAVLSLLDPSGLTRATAVIVVLEAMIGALVYLSKYAGKIKSLKGTLVALTVCLSILALSIAALSLLDTKSIMTATAAMSLVMGMLVAIIAVTKFAGKGLMTTLLGIAAVMGVLGGLLIAISLLGVDDAMGSALALSVLMGALAGSLFIISNMKTNTVKATSVLKSMLLMLVPVAAIIALLATFKMDLSVETASAVGVLIGALAGSTVAIGYVKEVSPGSIKALASVTAALVVVGALLGVMDHFDVEPSISSVVALSSMLLALSGVTAILSSVGQMPGVAAAAAKGGAALAIVVGIVVALFSALSGLTYIAGDQDSLEEFLDRGILVLQKIGKGIGDLVGYFLGGVAEGIASVLPAVGEGISGFVESLMPAIEDLSTVDGKALLGAGYLVAIVAAIFAAEVISTYTRVFDFLTGGSSTKSMFEDLQAFGAALVKFSNTISGNVDAEAVNSAANAGKLLSELANGLPASGGFLQKILGEKQSMSSFGKQLVSFGGCLVQFSNVITGKTPTPDGVQGAINPTAIQASAAAGKLLSELANSLPEVGGKWQEWFGGTKLDLGTFGDQLKRFGHCLVEYSKEVSKDGAIDKDAIEASTNAATILVNFANTLPEYDGVIKSWFSTDKVNLKTFGQQIKQFGSAIVGYSLAVSKEGAIDSEAISASTKAATLLVNLANNLPEYDGVIKGWFGTDKANLKEFGNQLKYFGTGVKAYSDAITSRGGINAYAVEKSATAASGLADVATKLPEYKTWIAKGWTGSGKATLSDFGKHLSGFGSGMKAYSDAITANGGIDAYAVEKSANAAVALSQVAVALPTYESALVKSTSGGKATIAEFGDHLGAFGADMLAFYDLTKSIEIGRLDSLVAEMGDIVSATVQVGQIDTDKLTAFGNLALGNFANNMKSLAEAFKEYSAVIKKNPTDYDAITKSVKALGGLVNVANALPHRDGKWQEWFGSPMDLTTFGENVVALGEALVDYSGVVASAGSINFDIVTSSTNAAQALANLANGLPDYGGRVSEWFGSQLTLEEFGKSLVSFGTSMVSYSNAISGKLDVATITATTNAVIAIETLANGLPEKGGKLEEWFTGSRVSLIDFGKELSSFGKYYAEYYTKIVNVNPTAINAATDALNGIVGILGAVQEFDPQQTTLFLTSMQAIGMYAVSSFLGSFRDSSTSVNAAMSTFMNGVESSLNAHALAASSDFGTCGQTLVSSMLNAITAKTESFKSAGITLMLTLADGLYMGSYDVISASKMITSGTAELIGCFKPSFFDAGVTIMEGLMGGVIDKGADLKTAMLAILNGITTAISAHKDKCKDRAKELMSSAIEGLNAKIAESYKSGANFVSGFVNGINDGKIAAKTAARAMANAAILAAKETLDEHSPSRKLYTIGKFGGLGFINALYDAVKPAEKAAGEMANASLEGVKDSISKIQEVISGEIDARPTITPVLDLSEFSSKAHKLNAELSREHAYSIGEIREARKTTDTNQNGVMKDKTSNSFNFVQNNYSPKALSRIEIYRQTKNQIAAMERKVST